MLLRRKVRYVLVEASEGLDLRDKATADDLERGLAGILGELHFADANPRISAQYSDKVFVLRMNRGTEASIILALSFIQELNRRPIGFYTIKTSGTINALLNEYKLMYQSQKRIFIKE